MLITRFKFFFNFTFILLNSVYKMDVNTKRCLPETVSKDGTAIKRSKVILRFSIYSFFQIKWTLSLKILMIFFSYISGVLLRKFNWNLYWCYLQSKSWAEISGQWSRFQQYTRIVLSYNSFATSSLANKPFWYCFKNNSTSKWVLIHN